MTFLGNNPAINLFVPQSNPWNLTFLIFGCIILGILFIVGLTMVPQRFRKPIVIVTTFAFGLFYFLEFMLPNTQMAPLRRPLSKAESHLKIAKQDIYAIIVGKGNRPERVAHANQQLTSAVTQLDQAQQTLIGLRSSAVRERDQALEKAAQWAKQHNIDDKLLDKSDDKSINDVRTRPLKKKVNDLDNVSARITRIKELANEISAGLGAASISQANEYYKSLEEAIENVALARTTLADNFLTPYLQPVGDLVIVIGALALGLGIYSLASLHGKILFKKKTGWGNSLAFFIAFIIMMMSGFLKDYAGNGYIRSVSDSTFDILFRGALTALSATMFSLVAFYIVSAAYRAFRVKSGEAGLMMASAFIVMLALVPFGVLLTDWIPNQGMWSIFRLENIGQWILKYPNTAAQRGIAFGIGVGGLAMSLRIWLSLERGSYFDRQL